VSANFKTEESCRQQFQSTNQDPCKSDSLTSFAKQNFPRSSSFQSEFRFKSKRKAISIWPCNSKELGNLMYKASAGKPHSWFRLHYLVQAAAYIPAADRTDMQNRMIKRYAEKKWKSTFPSVADSWETWDEWMCVRPMLRWPLGIRRSKSNPNQPIVEDVRTYVYILHLAPVEISLRQEFSGLLAASLQSSELYLAFLKSEKPKIRGELVPRKWCSEVGQLTQYSLFGHLTSCGVDGHACQTLFVPWIKQYLQDCEASHVSGWSLHRLASASADRRG
jgi:hypothetical protein